MEQPYELESTYAAIVETKEELFEMISKKLSKSKDLADRGHSSSCFIINCLN